MLIARYCAVDRELSRIPQETVNKAVVATEGTARTPTGSGKSIADITPTEKEQADVTDSPALVACRIALSKAEKNYSTSEIEVRLLMLCDCLS